MASKQEPGRTTLRRDRLWRAGKGGVVVRVYTHRIRQGLFPASAAVKLKRLRNTL